MEDIIKTNVKTTLPINKATKMGKNFEKKFDSTLANNGMQRSQIDEIDSLLQEKEQSLKKKIWDLSKMESLVFSDQFLTGVYNKMAEDGEDKYGYHYNETIMNILFNKYILNDAKYLQKYKMAIPKEKKRRDKSGIHQLQQDIEHTPMKKEKNEANSPVEETTGAASSGSFAPAMGYEKKKFVEEGDNKKMKDDPCWDGYEMVGKKEKDGKEVPNCVPENENKIEETTTSSSSGQYSTPKAWAKPGKQRLSNKPAWKGGEIIKSVNEGNYLTNPDGFKLFEEKLKTINEWYDDEYYEKPKYPQGMGKFEDIDWKVLFESLVYNEEVLNKKRDGILYNRNDFTDYDGMLSNEELDHLAEYGLIEMYDIFPILGQYANYDQFYNKAKEIWNKESNNINVPDPETKVFNAMQGGVGESIDEDSYVDSSGKLQYNKGEELFTDEERRKANMYLLYMASPEHDKLYGVHIPSTREEVNSLSDEEILKIMSKIEDVSDVYANKGMRNEAEQVSTAPATNDDKLSFIVNFMKQKSPGADENSLRDLFSKYNEQELNAAYTRFKAASLPKRAPLTNPQLGYFGEAEEYQHDDKLDISSPDFNLVYYISTMIKRKYDIPMADAHDATEFGIEKLGGVESVKSAIINDNSPKRVEDLLSMYADTIYKMSYQTNEDLNEHHLQSTEDKKEFICKAALQLWGKTLEPNEAKQRILNIIKDKNDQEIDDLYRAMEKKLGITEQNIDEKSKSKSQQRFMGMVRAAQKGEMENPSAAVKKAAKEMKPSDVKDFAKTKHEDLPEKVNEVLSDEDKNALYVEYVNDRQDEDPFMMHGQKFQFVNGKYPSGKIDIAVYSFAGDLTYGYNVFRRMMGIDKRMGESMIDQNSTSMIADNPTTMAKGMKDIQPDSVGVSSVGGIRESSNEVNEDGFCRKDEIPVSGKVKGEEGACKKKKTLVKVDPEDMKKNPHNTKARLERIRKYETELEKKKSEYEKNLEKHKKEMEKMGKEEQPKKQKTNEDKRPSTLVMLDRLKSQNDSNFKSDLNNSGIKDVIDNQNELMAKDQVTQVGDNPYELGEKIEAEKLKKFDALKNVGDSTNDSGDEIPKRNLTPEEQKQLSLHRAGQEDWNYDRKPSERFEERMKKDMGEEIYQNRQDKMKFRAEAPMYNKDTAPAEFSSLEKVQYDSNKRKFNDQEGYTMEGFVSGKYVNEFGKTKFVNFNLSEAKQIEKPTSDMFSLNMEGLGNTYTQRVFEDVNIKQALENLNFYINKRGNVLFTSKKMALNEQENVKTETINENLEKMKKLMNYSPAKYADISAVKKIKF